MLAFYWISSTAAVSNNTSNETTNNPSNKTSDKPFSCEWKDLEFPITYGPGIACSLCILIGGFHVIVGEDKNPSCILFICKRAKLLILKRYDVHSTALITKRDFEST